MYDRLKQVVESVKIIDNHGHPGFAEYFEGLPEEHRVSFAVDSFKTPEEVAAGFPYIRELHYEAYQKLQDLLVWYILRQIVSLDMVVQFHFAVTDNYVNYFDPMNLANILEDEELKNIKLVILHGGYPRYGQAELLALGGITPNNVCIDISGRIMFANHPKIIAKMLRNLLEKPLLWDKILYGSDVLFGERYIYTCARTVRDSVYYALAGMIDEDIIDEDTGIMISNKILRDNAIRLYKL